MHQRGLKVTSLLMAYGSLPKKSPQYVGAISEFFFIKYIFLWTLKKKNVSCTIFFSTFKKSPQKNWKNQFSTSITLFFTRI